MKGSKKEKKRRMGSFFELATTNRKRVNGLNLHQIKSEVLEDY